MLISVILLVLAGSELIRYEFKLEHIPTAMGIFPHCNGDYSPPIGGKFPTQIKKVGN